MASVVLSIALLTPAVAVAVPSPAVGAPDHLRVDGLANPVGIDDTPSFSWHVVDPSRGAVQAAYRVVVGTTAAVAPDGPGVVWDSGRVPSAEQAFVAYGGPPLASDAVYWWTVQTWPGPGPPGPFAVAQHFGTGLHDGDWRASWIRRATNDAVDAADEYTYARKQVRLRPSPVVRAVAYVSADQQYQLWIDGTRADAGEAFAYPDSQLYQATDVTSLLRGGAVHAIGVLYHWYGVGKGRPAGSAGLIVQVSVDHADGTHELVVTDGSWRVSRAPWLPATQRNEEGDPVDYTEHVDGAAVPTGWDRPGFDDRLWRAAVVIGRPPVAPWTHLIGQRTRIVETPVRAVALSTLANGAVVADFGQVMAAVPTVRFGHGVAGRLVTMHAGYLLDAPAPGQPVEGVPGQVSTTHGTQHTDMSYAYVQAAGVQTFRPFDYLGFRYLQIDDPGETLAPTDVVAYARRSAMPDDGPAAFTSSDPVLDAVFGLAEHSALFGSQEQFIDTPTREKGPFLRDGFNISETAMRAFGEQDLSRRALLEFAQSQVRYWKDEGRLNAIYPSGQGQRDIPDFTEIYPEWVWQYFMATGDRDLLATTYPVLQAIADYVARAVDGRTGLVTNLPGGSGDYQYGIVDWPKGMRYGYDMATAARTTVNMLAVDVFARVGAVASVLGRPAAERDRQAQRRDALAAAINGRLRRPDGVYVDGARADGSPSAHASQHANAYALAYDVAPPATRDAVGTSVAGLGMAMGPQTAQELLVALHEVGRDADVVRLLTDRAHDGWANVLARGGTYTWETWNPSDANGDSMSHAWGATALVAIQEELLGVVPTAPGFAALEIRPPTGGLQRAAGSVPTERGQVEVSWSRPTAPGGVFELRTTVPPNATATVAVPATTAAAVSEGGLPAGRAPGVRLIGMDGDLAVLAVGAGTYDFRSDRVPAGYIGLASGRPPTPGGAFDRASAGAAGVGAGGPDRAAPSTTGGARAGRQAASHGRASRSRGPAWLAAALALLSAGLVVVVARRRRDRAGRAQPLP